jgi:SAM-dependent methyltransferase
MQKASGLKYSIEYDLDDPRRTIIHGKIIKSKPFLRRIYLEWYNNFKNELSGLPEGKIVEIGSGGGFIKEIIPNIITSDILPNLGCDLTFSAESLPFEDNSLSAIIMLNVFHHIPRVEKFLAEANRCLIPGGKIIMTETANSVWSRFIYKNFHHEAFDPAGDWNLNGEGPLSVSNQALPFIVFERDVELFRKKFPALSLIKLEYHTPLKYLISGGVSRKALAPYFTYDFIDFVERLLKPFNKFIGMFVNIVIQKNNL